MGDTSFFIRYDIYSIFAIFFRYRYFPNSNNHNNNKRLFSSLWLQIEYVFNTFIFSIVTNITTNSDPAHGPLSTTENELLW
jgi:hypothetical protein